MVTVLFITWKNVGIVSLAWFEGSSILQSHQLEGTAAGKQATALAKGRIDQAAAEGPAAT